jgi:hypothetical protein
MRVFRWLLLLAERVRAEAQAYERERAADAAAYAERASVQQMERDAAHERTLETLPFVLAIGGGTLVALIIVVGAALLWREQSLHAAQPRPAPQTALATAPQPATLDDLLAYLQQREAALWHALAILARRQSPPPSPVQAVPQGANLLDTSERR